MCVVAVRSLNIHKVIEIRRLSGIENFASEIDKHVFSSLRNLNLRKTTENRSDVLEPGQQFQQEYSGCVGDNLFDILEYHSTELQ